MSAYEQLLEHAGVPALLLAFAATVWLRTESHAREIRDLWSLTNGKDGHSEKIAKIEARMEKSR
jgi:hypothetical protein